MDTLVILGFLTDLLSRFLITEGILPGSTSWLSQALLMTVVAFALVRMMLVNRIPLPLLAIAGVVMISATVAFFRGQGIMASFWGAWQWLRFPLVGLYAYLRPSWPDHFPDFLVKLTLGVLAFEAVFQTLQYLRGDPLGDSLAGSFGYKGAGEILFLGVFSVALALGQWLARKKWRPLMWTLVFGAASSVMAENKMFPVAVFLMATLAILFYILRGAQPLRVLMLGILMAAGLWLFATGYDQILGGGTDQPLQEKLLDADTREGYLTQVSRAEGTSRFKQGRNALVGYIFDSISGDGVTLLWGYGMGSRRGSSTLGVVGKAIEVDRYMRGSDLAVLIQEMGLFGLAVAAVATLWLGVALFRDIRGDPDSEALALRYGLLLFSLLWPLWLWYKRPLETNVTMWLYCISLGYVFGGAHKGHLDAPQ
jgi:hypothetical protein